MRHRLKIRDFQAIDSDYALLASIHNHCWPDERVLTASLRAQDNQSQADGNLVLRLMVEQDELPVGFGELRQMPTEHQAKRFQVMLGVLTDYRRHGIATALFQQLMSRLEPYHPGVLFAVTYIDRQDALGLLKKLAFRESGRAWKQILDVQAFDDTPFANYNRRLERQQIHIVTYADLRHDPHRDWHLHALECQLMADMPVTDRAVVMSLEAWQQVCSTENPEFIPSGFFVAMHDNEYIGMCQVWRTGDPTRWHHGMTGVARTFRGRGIGTALKLAVIRHAQDSGIRALTTFNDSQNIAMLRINERLGFRKLRAELLFKKLLSDHNE